MSEFEQAEKALRDIRRILDTPDGENCAGVHIDYNEWGDVDRVRMVHYRLREWELAQ